MTGMVLFFDDNKGYGFIRPDDGRADIFVHYGDIADRGYKTLYLGEIVTFDVNIKRHHGKQAVNVRRRLLDACGGQEDNRWEMI